MQTYIIIGNGIAGLKAAQTIRNTDQDAQIILIGKEGLYPYSKPGLMYLSAQRMSPEDLYLHEPSFYYAKNIKLMQDEVLEIAPDKHEISLRQNGVLSYTKLLLATGSKPRASEAKNSNLSGIYSFNNLKDAKELLKNATASKKAIVAGGGLTGLEVVECLMLHGGQVTYLVREKWFFDRALSQQEADLVKERLLDKGVKLVLEEEIIEFLGTKQLVGVKTAKGQELACDLCYIAIGVVPEISLASKAGLKTARGIWTDEFQQTAHPDIYAAGDCAEIPGENNTRKVELLWYAAQNQGKIAGLNMLGIPTLYNAGTFYNSALFLDIDYMSVGRLNAQNSEEKIFEYRHPHKKITVRILYDQQKVLGINLLGQRYDKEKLLFFIESQKNLAFVLKNLAQATFNPEFSRKLLKELNHAS